MKLDGKIKYEEILHLLHELKKIIIGNYIKNIYHYEGLWMFKFNKFNFVFEPGISIWPGTFEPREKNIHSICIKLRKEIVDKKIKNFLVNQNDRTIIFEFFNGKFLCLEIFAKGNLILCDENKKIIVLTRPNSFTIHGNIYNINLNLENVENKYFEWKKKNYEIIETNIKTENSFTFNNGLEILWNIRKLKLVKTEEIKKNKKKKFTKYQNIENQIKKIKTNINELLENASKEENNTIINYESISEIYQKIKILKNKLQGAENALKLFTNKVVKKNKSIKIELISNKWYHEFHWWFTIKGILVIGGKNADQNEKIVKTYLMNHHIYFHSDEPGSGSFIYMIDKDYDIKSDAELDTISQGVLSLSQNWKNNRNGKVYWVYGNQVSKTPPSGEFITKGSFMIKGNRNYISVHQLCLGYCLYNNNELMLGPYNLISKLKTKCIKLVPKENVKKNIQKDIIKNILNHFNILKIPDKLYIFSFASFITLNDFSEK